VSFGVILFQSTHHAFQAERRCLEAGLKVKLIPTPRQFSAECGTALRFDWTDQDHIAALLGSDPLVPVTIQPLEIDPRPR